MQIKVVIFLASFLIRSISCYQHTHCSRAIRSDFQLHDCHVPPLSIDLLFSSANFVLSHNAATGYITPTRQILSKASLSWSYTKNQVGTIYQQLNDGARALDLRPLLLSNGTMTLQHGSIAISVSMETIVESALDWCRENPDELVLMLTSHFAYSASSTSSSTSHSYSNNNSPTTSMTGALASLYEEYGVTYAACGDVYGLTIGQVMELAASNNAGGSSRGYLLAMDAHDYFGTSCSKENWVPRKLVTCWSKTKNTTHNSLSSSSCHTSDEPWTKLRNYMLASANNDATDNRYTLGPPSDLQSTPLNQIQAFWQVNTRAVAQGLLHASSILQDNRVSHVNERVVELAYSGALQQNFGLLLAVDNVALHGNALLSVLRTACGQSDELSDDECGQQIPLPRMRRFRMTAKRIVLAFAVSYVIASAVWLLLYRRPGILRTLLSRLKEDTKVLELEDSVTSRNKTLLLPDEQVDAR